MGLEVFDGLMLGDGCITRPSKECVNYIYSHTCMEPTYLAWANKYLPIPATKIYGPYVVKDGFKIGAIKYVLHSPVDKFYTEQRERWYVNGIKIVPQDLALTPNVMLAWFLGDGWLNQTGNKIGFATESFTWEENYRLIEKLIALNLSCRIDKTKFKKPFITINTTSVNDFLTYIGVCPLEFYAYKWDWKWKPSVKKLIPEQVFEIRSLLKNRRLSKTFIAGKFGVTKQLIRRIEIGKAWGKLKEV